MESPLLSNRINRGLKCNVFHLQILFCLLFLCIMLVIGKHLGTSSEVNVGMDASSSSQPGTRSSPQLINEQDEMMVQHLDLGPRQIPPPEPYPVPVHVRGGARGGARGGLPQVVRHAPFPVLHPNRPSPPQGSMHPNQQPQPMNLRLPPSIMPHPVPNGGHRGLQQPPIPNAQQPITMMMPPPPVNPHARIIYPPQMQNVQQVHLPPNLQPGNNQVPPGRSQAQNTPIIYRGGSRPPQGSARTNPIGRGNPRAPRERPPGPVPPMAASPPNIMNQFQQGLTRPQQPPALYPQRPIQISPGGSVRLAQRVRPNSQAPRAVMQAHPVSQRPPPRPIASPDLRPRQAPSPQGSPRASIPAQQADPVENVPQAILGPGYPILPMHDQQLHVPQAGPSQQVPQTLAVSRLFRQQGLPDLDTQEARMQRGESSGSGSRPSHQSHGSIDTSHGRNQGH